MIGEGPIHYICGVVGVRIVVLVVDQIVVLVVVIVILSIGDTPPPQGEARSARSCAS